MPPVWAIGDTIGLAANVTEGKIAVALNGKWTGVVFEGSAIQRGVYAAFSTQSATVAYTLQAPFRYGPPEPAVWG